MPTDSSAEDGQQGSGGLGTLVLASASPRRRSLLESVGWRLTVVKTEVDETREPGEPPRELVVRLAQQKAAAAEEASSIVVAADTVVVWGDEVIGKPQDDGEAKEILEKLSGRSHDVLTGYCVRCADRVIAGVVVSEVEFRSLSPEAIESYIATGEPRDKAGAYGIQGLGGALVERVTGSYTNVVGLPLTEVLSAIHRLAGPADLPAVGD